MIRPTPHVVIDARPRGPRGPLTAERVLGRPVLDHLMDLAGALAPAGPVAIHARIDEHEGLRSALGGHVAGRYRLATGPPPEGAAILRSDRLYDPARLRRAVLNGRDPETAVIWRLDRPRGLDGADAELIRRRTYQPIGRFWALGPARLLARLLRPTRVRPNALTLGAGGLVLAASALVAFAPMPWASRWLAAGFLAAALVLDTADGHLARLQGTASEFGRWLDAVLDEMGDMALHAGIAYAAFVRDAHPAWLGAGMLYAMGKYVFMVSNQDAPAPKPTADAPAALALPETPGLWRGLLLLAGHADIRWHLWIVLAAVGRLDAALVSYSLYFPLRAMAGAARKVARHA
ncbi:CDP-alcohol phosphatidyltransferase family protein [Tundrisphaera sp. TA3]|uniref:CDP-alcohol phosphatidyltransferase family protein n=1 Tax=Tundrisphaera sp. TA3 TaxID=3435775 RepID=UPI003EB8E472